MTKPTHEERAQAIAAVVDTLKKVSAPPGAPNVRIVTNLAAYVLLLDDDLGHLTEELVQAKTTSHRVFLAKNEASLLYEAADDLPHMIGKDFRAAATTIGATPDQMERIKAVSSDMSAFFKTHGPFLKEVRTNVGSHRDNDALTYIATLAKVEPLEVMNRAAEFTSPLRRLAGLLIELFDMISSQVMAYDILRGYDAQADADGNGKAPGS